jgi:hypothetical protein
MVRHLILLWLSVTIGNSTIVGSAVAAPPADNFPDSEKMFAALSVCALNADLTVDASIQGSLRSLFRDTSTQGKFSIRTTSAFLELFPAKDKLKAYRAYRYCLFTTLNLSPETVCGRSSASPLTRVALARFTVSANLAGQEDIFTTLLGSLLRRSHKYLLVSSESDQRAMANLADSDPILAIAMANEARNCTDQAELAILPSAAYVGDSVITSTRVVDVASGKLLRTPTAEGPFRTLAELKNLLRRTWREIEQGLSPESWIWRDGVGFCNRLKYVTDNYQKASCAGDETFKLMSDQRTGNAFVDNCQYAWRRNQMEPVCMFRCDAGRIKELFLYKRLDGKSLTGTPRSASQQREFIERLKKSYGYTDEQLASVNIKLIYPGEDLTDPEDVFHTAMNDIQACLPSWTAGSILAGSVDGTGADQGAKNVTFSSGTGKLTLDLLRSSPDNRVQWNFLSLYLK